MESESLNLVVVLDYSLSEMVVHQIERMLWYLFLVHTHSKVAYFVGIIYCIVDNLWNSSSKKHHSVPTNMKTGNFDMHPVWDVLNPVRMAVLLRIERVEEKLLVITLLCAHSARFPSDASEWGIVPLQMSAPTDSIEYCKEVGLTIVPSHLWGPWIWAS